MQWYVIVVVRSEILKLEESQMRERDAQDVTINVDDRDTLL